MYNSFEQIPWIIAVLGAAIIGGVSFVSIGDFWISIERSGVGFALFWGVGYLIQKVLEAPPKKHNAAMDHHAAFDGTHNEQSSYTSEPAETLFGFKSGDVSDDDKE